MEHPYYELGRRINAAVEAGKTYGEAVRELAALLRIDPAEIRRVIAFGPPSDGSHAWW